MSVFHANAWIYIGTADLVLVLTGSRRIAPSPDPDANPHLFRLPHPSIALLDRSQWARVRTVDGATGRVSHDYLDHD